MALTSTKYLNSAKNHAYKNRMAKLGAIISACLVMVACGGSGQDVGTPANFSTELSGRVIDGYLARATVFVDTNNNGTRDPWEPFAFTDDEGYYSYNPNSDTDYCAASASAEQQQYCLNLNTDISNFVIRIDSGYDILTGEPFIGQMSRRINIRTESERDVIISPLTTLVTSFEDTESQQSILSQLGLEEPDLNIDYLHTDTFNAQLLNTALTVHKSVTLLSDRLTDVYIEIGDNLGTPNDASQSVYRSLAQELVDSETGLDNVLQSPTSLLTVLDNAEATLRDIYTLRELDLPQDIGSIEIPTDFERTVEITRTLPTIVDEIIDPETVTTLADDVVGRARLLETLVVKSVEDNNHSDPSVDNAIEFITNNNNDELIEQLTERLSGENSFVSELVRNDFTGDDFDSADDFENAVSLPEGANAFTALAGKTVRLSDPDLGYGPSNLKDIEVAFFLRGEENGVSGTLSACAKYIEGANTDGSLGEGNTRGELIEGYWTLLGASTENNSSYSILITITFLGATYQAIIKPAGYVMVDGEERYALRFDFDGDIRDWQTENGFEISGTVPSTSQDCEALLPSRIGL